MVNIVKYCLDYVDIVGNIKNLVILVKKVPIFGQKLIDFGRKQLKRLKSAVLGQKRAFLGSLLDPFWHL